jgi:hypothetical protein
MTAAARRLVLAGVALAGCAHAPPAAPTPATADAPARGFKNVPPRAFQAELVEHAMPHLPDQFKIAHVNQDFVFLGKVCAAADGPVVSVSVLESIPGADEAIVGALRQWRIRQQPTGQGLCTLTKFEFSLRGRFR